MRSPHDPRAFLSRELRPEARLILSCARSAVPRETAEQIAALVASPLDWELVCESADKHRVTQLLVRNLSAHGSGSMPREIEARLRHRFHTNAGSNLRLARALIELTQRFEAAGIPVVPYKGSILAASAYGKLALRQHYDIDLLVRERDVERSHRLLEEAEYLREEGFDRESRYKRAGDDVEVDLHWGFTPRYFHLPVDFDALWERAGPVTLMGHPLVTFSAEDLLEILCVQVVKDAWERRQQLEHLAKVCDIAEHLRANPSLRWPRVLESAERKGLRRIVGSALSLARGLLGAELPAEVSERIAADRSAGRCARWMCRSLFTQADVLSPLQNPRLSVAMRTRQLSFYLSVRERHRDRLRHLREILGI